MPTALRAGKRSKSARAGPFWQQNRMDIGTVRTRAGRRGGLRQKLWMISLISGICLRGKGASGKKKQSSSVRRNSPCANSRKSMAPLLTHCAFIHSDHDTPTRLTFGDYPASRSVPYTIA